MRWERERGRHLKSSNSTSVENSTDNEQSEIDCIAVANSKFRQCRALFAENLAILNGIFSRDRTEGKRGWPSCDSTRASSTVYIGGYIK